MAEAPRRPVGGEPISALIQCYLRIWCSSPSPWYLRPGRRGGLLSPVRRLVAPGVAAMGGSALPPKEANLFKLIVVCGLLELLSSCGGIFSVFFCSGGGRFVRKSSVLGDRKGFFLHFFPSWRCSARRCVVLVVGLRILLRVVWISSARMGMMVSLSFIGLMLLWRNDF